MLEQIKAQLDASKMNKKLSYKKELMQLEFQYNMQLKGRWTIKLLIK